MGMPGKFAVRDPMRWRTSQSCSPYPMSSATVISTRPHRLVRAAIAIMLLVGLIALVAPPANAHRFNAGAYGSDSSRSGYAMKRRIGFNTVYLGVTLGGIKGTLASLDRLHARGMKAVIWLGSYDRQVHCGFERDDTWIQTVVAGLAGNPAIAAYQLGDEVNGRRTVDCGDVPAAMKARTNLIKSIDPSAHTYVTLGMFGEPHYFEYEKYVGTADILGLVIYPCVRQHTECVWAKIRKAIRAAKHDRVPRYWAVVQDFGNSWYRQPTRGELRRQLRMWRRSRISGYFVYNWKLGGIDTKRGHRIVFRRSNHYFRTRHRV
jgi:hypothetical protein